MRRDRRARTPCQGVHRLSIGCMMCMRLMFLVCISRYPPSLCSRSGKTSTILAVARKINGPKYSSMVLELNASDDRGIDVVREQIKDFASSRKLFSTGLKLVILVRHATSRHRTIRWFRGC
jgi:hypothetical protein